MLIRDARLTALLAATVHVDVVLVAPGVVLGSRITQVDVDAGSLEVVLGATPACLLPNRQCLGRRRLMSTLIPV